MSTLVENNMTNKPMGHKITLRELSLCKVTLERLPSLQVSYKGKTNTHSHSQGLYLFVNYELYATLNNLNWKFSEI